MRELCQGWARLASRAVLTGKVVLGLHFDEAARGALEF
jgi:hypothetical protein